VGFQLPKFIRIGGNTFKLQFNRVPDGSNRFGETDYANNVINIGSQNTPERIPSTLLHELIHAICTDRHIDMGENEVDNLANGLVAVLQDLDAWPWEIAWPGEKESYKEGASGY